MAGRCVDRASCCSSSYSAVSQRGTAASIPIQHYNSYVRYSQQLACELETKKETAVEVEGHGGPFMSTIGQPQTELRTCPAGQPSTSGQFNNIDAAKMNGRTDSESRLLLRSFGCSDGWRDASNLHPMMRTRKHSVEGFCEDNEMESKIESESEEAQISSSASSESDVTIQWAIPPQAPTPLPSASAPPAAAAALAPLLCKGPADPGRLLLCDVSLNDFIAHMTIPPPPPLTTLDLATSVKTDGGVLPPTPPDSADHHLLSFGPQKSTDKRTQRRLERRVPSDPGDGSVSTQLNTTDDDVQLLPLTIPLTSLEDALARAQHLHLYGSISHNDAMYIRLEEDFAKLVTPPPPPPPPHQITKKKIEIQRPTVPLPHLSTRSSRPVSAVVNHPLLPTLPPHPPHHRSGGRGHPTVLLLSSNRSSPSHATPPGSLSWAGQAVTDLDETDRNPSSAPPFSQRKVDGSSTENVRDIGDQQKPTIATAAAAAAALYQHHESPSNTAAHNVPQRVSEDAVGRHPTHCKAQNNTATLPRTAPPSPPTRLNSAINSSSANKRRPNRRVSFDMCPLEIEGCSRQRESSSPPSSNREEPATRQSRRTEANLPQSCSLSRLINVATNWVGCGQSESPVIAQIRPHAIRSSSASAFQSIVKDDESSGPALAAGPVVDFGRKVRSSSFGDASTSSNVSVFSNLKSRLKSYWSPSMTKRNVVPQGSAIDQSRDAVSSLSSKRSSSDGFYFALETPDGGNRKTNVKPQRRSASRTRMEPVVKAASIFRMPAAEDGDAHLDYIPSLKQNNVPNTFNTFTGSSVS